MFRMYINMMLQIRTRLFQDTASRTINETAVNQDRLPRREKLLPAMTETEIVIRSISGYPLPSYQSAEQDVRPGFA